MPLYRGHCSALLHFTERLTMTETTPQGIRDLHRIVEQVIAQIEADLYDGDITAIEELLLALPRANLEAYLPYGLRGRQLYGQNTLEGRWHTRSNGQPLDTED